ncbi:UDP-glucose:glycoprotein glucosyltransferase-domain-containing protein [Powellomyces hirtus]|nr:UDP-glucose:glycoprotein glucosyltransferase-domain-containing protein [Powellomyces hirtus]
MNHTHLDRILQHSSAMRLSIVGRSLQPCWTLLLFLGSFCLSQAEVPLVSTTLKTEWHAPPQILEAVEFVANEGKTYVFDYLTHLASNDLLSRSARLSDEKLYKQIVNDLTSSRTNGGVDGVQIVSDLTSLQKDQMAFVLDQRLIPLLKLALALRSAAPRVQAQYRLYLDEVVPEFSGSGKSFDAACESWVDWYGVQACSPNKVEQLAASFSSSKHQSEPQIYSFDHVYRVGHNASAPVAVLYADCQSRTFTSFHQTLLRLAQEHGLTYVLRYKPGADTGKPLTVSGYGVELALKSTEYKVTDDREIQKGEDGDQQTNSSKQVDENDQLRETPARIVPLLANETIDLGLKTAQLILKSTHPINSLVDVIQNFPKFAHLLKDVKLDKEITASIEANQMKMPGQRNRLWINGMEHDMLKLDIFSLQRTLRSETSRVASFMALNLTSDQAIALLTTPLVDKSETDVTWGDAFDVRSDLVVWWNDLEKDSRYSRWPKDIMDLLRPSYPGQLKFMRKNLMQLVFQLDLTNPAHLRVMLQAFEFVERDIPLRFGIAPLVDETDPNAPASIAALAFYHLRRTHKLKDAKRFIVELYGLSEASSLDAKAVQEAYLKLTNKPLGKALDEWKEEREELYQELLEFGLRTGVERQAGALFANGKHLDIISEWQQPMLSLYMQMVEYLTQQVYAKKVTDSTHIYDHFLSLPNVYPRRHNLIFGPARLVDFLACGDCRVLDHLKWTSFDSQPSAVSVVAIADFNSEAGASFALDALGYLKEMGTEGVRLTLLQSGPEPFKAFPDLVTQVTTPTELATIVKILDAHKALQSQVQTFIQGLDLEPSQKALIVNGRVVGPIPSSVEFDYEDIGLLSSVEFRLRIGAIASKVAEYLGDPGESPEKTKLISDAILKATSAVAAASTESASSAPAGMTAGARSRLPLNAFAQLNATNSAITVGDEKKAVVKIFAIVDPLTELAQKLSALLRVISQLDGTYMQIMLNPEPKVGESLPIKRFYRYVLAAEPQFDTSGKLQLPNAEFHGLPLEPLYTLGMDVANSWIVFPRQSVEDLDNIRLAKLQGRGVVAEFLLENILVEGHARESQTGGPPRGLQFLLGTKQDPSRLDTITMANLGYLQLKANPGIWDLRLREGRSRELYDILSVSDTLKPHDDSNVPQSSVKVVLNSFEGVTMYPVVAKKPGMQNEELLVESSDANDQASASGMWSKMKTTLFGKQERQNKGNGTINIFSVASGHLYERFLSIMMLSVVKNTKSPVKFWFISNFLSPSFKAFIPHLAKAYGFEYELVTYKWPHWLRQQTEKQRTIWGYKILFLDVLFPLDLTKVIFVDADQVVRTDLKELVDMDLKGAVYGYTPFCDDRTEMDGFRFWKHGYWKDHLGGKPYHISALYVVDLNRFRQLAAGDRLRQQYQMLSADPHSLANLDQDLPNNMNTPQQIPIYSLPQEWLWCETWCSDESLKTAKTIDLCNNPLTKEPKLERAKRILPEWEGLDAEVAAIAARVAGNKPASSSVPPAASTTQVSDEHAKDEL